MYYPVIYLALNTDYTGQNPVSGLMREHIFLDRFPSDIRISPTRFHGTDCSHIKFSSVQLYNHNTHFNWHRSVLMNELV